MAAAPNVTGTTAIQAPTGDNTQVVLRQLKEVAEVGQRQRGDPSDSFVRVSDLVQAGIIRLVGKQIFPPAAILNSGAPVPSSRNILTIDSIIGGGSLIADLTLQLSGDAATPGNTMLYGTNGSGVKGWYTQPAGFTSPLSTKGDILGFNTGNARVPIGADGTILIADSTQTLGLKWGTNIATAVFQKGATWVNTSGVVVVPTNDVIITLPRACTLTLVTILTVGGTGSCNVDIWKSTLAAFPPVIGGAITGGVPPAITSGKTYTNSVLSGWTTSFSAGDVLLFHLNSSSTFTEISITLQFS